MPLLRTITLGCKVNQYESEYLREGLAQLGYREARGEETADLCIVNTCTVTVEGEAKSRKLIRQLARQNPGAEIVVMGCYASRAPQEVARLGGVAEVIVDKGRLREWLVGRGLAEPPAGISTFGHRQRAYVKVQDGCRMGCSYCIIPRVRPVLQSRPVPEILAEVGRLVAVGHREIVLTGIHLGHFGAGPFVVPPLGGIPPKGGTTNCGIPPEGGTTNGGIPPEGGTTNGALSDLVRQIAGLPGKFRVRLSSLEASEVTDELLAVMGEHPERVCPHLHIPLQSGSNAVLGRMRRRWPVERIIERLGQVRRVLDQPALTSDVIVGFPGETEQDFRATCEAVEAAGFSKLHVFRFSPREGTEAASMPDRVPGVIQQERAARLAELGRRQRSAYFQSLAGRRLQVLVESQLGSGMLLGTSDRYAPVELPATPAEVGQIVWVTAGPVVGGRIRAEFPLSPPSG